MAGKAGKNGGVGGNGVKVHRPRKQTSFDKQNVQMMQEQMDRDGFVALMIEPRIYNIQTQKFTLLKGHTLGMRAFTFDALKDLLQAVEDACHAE